MSLPTPLRLPRVASGFPTEATLVSLPDEYAFLREHWAPGLERIALMVLQQDLRTLGVTGVGPRVGVSAASRLIAEILARAGHGALHIDLSLPDGDGPDWQAWPSPQVDPRPWIIDGAGGPSRLLAQPTRETRDHFHDTPRLRRLFGAETLKGQPIVLDLPPLVDGTREAINPLGAAAACDAVVLVCGRGRTTRKQLAEALATCQASGIELTGLIINDIDYVSPARELAEAGRRMFGFIPPLARWIEARALRMEILQ